MHGELDVEQRLRSEHFGPRLNPLDGHAPLGDGAGAVVIGPSDFPGIAAPVWGSDGSKADAVVSLKVPGQPELITRLDSHSDRHTMCAVALLENASGAIQVTKLVDYFPSHVEMDQQFGFGFRWSQGSK